MDDLEVVAILDADLAKRRARHDFEIALDSNAQRIEAELVQHLGNSDFARYPAVFAVDPNSKASIETH
jgi:replication fork clamp-binding protein CrfC